MVASLLALLAASRGQAQRFASSPFGAEATASTSLLATSGSLALLVVPAGLLVVVVPIVALLDRVVAPACAHWLLNTAHALLQVLSG